MNTFIKAIRVTLALLMLAALTACGHSAPTESDAKTAIEARLGDCEYFKVTDFTKVNGRELDDTDYRVEIKYMVEIAPGKYSDKLRDFKQAFDQIKDIRVQYGARMDELNTAHVQKVNDGTQETAAEADAFSNISNTDPVLLKLKAQATAITDQLKADNNNGLTSFEQGIRRDCPNLRVRNGFLATFLNPRTDLDALADGQQAQFTENMWMVKTDNGWQEAH